MILQLMKEEDIPEVYTLYDHILRNTTALLETELPSITDFTEKMISNGSIYPTILLKEHGEIIGFACSSICNDQSGCAWNCRLSIYIKPAYRHQDLGKALLTAAIDLLSLQGYYNVFCYTILPDEETLLFFRSQGFKVEGINQNHGFKNGRWHDRVILKRSLLEYTEPDRIPRTIREISREALETVFSKCII